MKLADDQTQEVVENGTAAPQADAAPQTAPEPWKSPPATARLVSLDAYRGFIMLAMCSSGFAFSRVARQLPDEPV